MARPRGARNVRPTDREEKELYLALKNAVQKGAANAAGWLLVLKNLEGKPPLKVINGQVIETR